MTQTPLHTPPQTPLQTRGAHKQRLSKTAKAWRLITATLDPRAWRIFSRS